MRFINLILCFLLTFQALASGVTNSYSVGTILAVAGGKVTSLNKVDGSFEAGSANWVASSGKTITRTASTEMQGNYVGRFAGTGTGTLDLPWAATSTNTYEASAQVKVDVPADYQICALVNSIETGCKVLTTTNVTKASVIADANLGQSFYLRLKHTSASAFIADVDDGKIEPWTPNIANLTEQESMIYYGNAGSAITANVTDITFSTISSSSLNQLGSWNGTRYTANKKQKIVLAAKAIFSASDTRMLFIYKNGVNADLESKGADSAIGSCVITTTLELNAGDYISIRTNYNSTLYNASTHRISITASAVSENIIQSYQDGMADWATLTYTQVNTLGVQGFTLNGGGYIWRRDGSDILIIGRATATSLTSSEVRIPLPSGLTISSKNTMSSAPLHGGTWARVTSTSTHGGLIITDPSVGYFNLSPDGVFGSASVSSMTKATGSGIIGDGQEFTFNARIPIQGWSSYPLLYVVPSVNIAYVKDVRSDGTSGGGTSTGSWNQRVINTLEGDTSFIALSGGTTGTDGTANVLTLQVGTYDVEIDSPVYNSNHHQVGLALSGSSSPDVIMGGAMYCYNSYGAQNTSKAIGRVVVTTPTSYKILHATETAQATNGFGTPSAWTGVEVYLQVKITKIK